MVHSNRSYLFWIVFSCLIISISFFVYLNIPPIFINITQNTFFILLISCIRLLLVYLILALASAFIFSLIVWIVFTSISQLGIYKKLNTEDPLHGESLVEKIKDIYIKNVFLSIILVSVIFYFLYPSGSTTFSDTSTITTTILSEIDKIYILAFAFVPAYLLSIRILANPTKDVFSIPIVKYYAHHPSHKNEFVKSFKREVISFYVALTIGAILYLFLKIMQAATNNQLETEIGKFCPQIDLIAICVLIIIYLIILLITTTIGEFILKEYQPYERL